MATFRLRRSDGGATLRGATSYTLRGSDLGGTTFPQALTATVTTTATITRSVGKIVTATVTTTASITKSVTKTLIATVTTTASIATTFIPQGAAAVAKLRTLLGLGT